MIRVCHITSAHGIEDARIFNKECVSIAQYNYDVYLVERGGSYEKQGVKIVGIGHVSSNRILRMTIGAYKAYKAAKKVKADIYHIHDIELLPYALHFKKCGKHVVFDSHENYYEQIRHKEYLFPKIAKLIAGLYLQFETYVAKKIDGIIYPCTFKGKILHENDCKNVVLIDNLVRRNLFDGFDESDKSHSRQMCFVGNLSDARCTFEIIEAAIKANVKLVLAGEFSDEEYKRKCLRLINDNSNISWLGQLKYKDALRVIKESYAGLCPEKNVGQYNTNDNLAMKSYEYMAAAIPVIVADYSFARKVMKEYKYGLLVDPNDTNEIAEAMGYLSNNFEEAQLMGRNGRRAIDEKYNWENEEKKLILLYEKITMC